MESKCFYLIKYFCGAQLASLQRSWASLRDNSSPSALSPSLFYVPLLQTLRVLHLPPNFSFSAKDFFSLLFVKVSSAPILPYLWNPFVSRSFALTRHWLHVRDNFTQNYKNDIAWLITLRAVKVRHSLRNWGYISSSQCASCSRIETIDHCFLNCQRAKSVWIHFTPLLSALLSVPFVPNCATVFFYEFQCPQPKNFRIVLFLIKTILFAIWKFRNKATFHNGKENAKAIIRYIKQDIRNRILLDQHRLSPNVFRDLWSHPALCFFREHDNLVFNF